MFLICVYNSTEYLLAMEPNKESLKLEIKQLIECGMFDSAEIIASLYISSCTAKTVDHSNNMDILELLGDAVFAKNEFKRALSQYRQAIQKNLQLNYKSRSQAVINTVDESRLKFKECKCLIALNDTNSAQRELESIPVKFRDVKINMLLGSLYKVAGLKRPAVAALRDALVQSPCAVEIVESLVSLGVEAGEITAVLDDSFREKDSPPFKSIGWMHTLVNALVTKRNYEHERSSVHFQKLDITFPQNVYLLSSQAEMLANDQDQALSAISMFRQVRRQSGQLIVNKMEVFAKVLYSRQEEADLNRLASEVLEVCPQRAAGWLAAALYCGLRGETEQSVQFVDKAVAFEPRNPECYKVRGMLLTAQNSLSQAQIAYSQANALDKDMASFVGLIDTYLQLNKLKDAALTAKEARTALPRSSMACILMGKVVSRSPQGAPDAIKAYQKALKLNPYSRAAASHLATVLSGQQKHEEAVECLSAALSKVSCPQLRLQLAKAQGALGLLEEAVQNLHTALSLTAPSEFPEALQELDAIESRLRAQNAADNEEFADQEEVFEEDGDTSFYE